MRILFITSNNLATNPRLVKEITLAAKMGYSGTVVQFHFGNWSDEPSQKLQSLYPSFSFISISASQQNLYDWFIASSIEKLFRVLPSSFLSLKHLSFSVSKRSFQILHSRKRLASHYNWVVAHNAASFYPAYLFAKQYNAKLGIDVEDYHPGEGNNPKMSERVLRLFKYILPKVHYASYASDQIREKVNSEINISNLNHFTIINSFYGAEFNYISKVQGDKLKLVWFSQYIDYERGLEPLLKYVSVHHQEFEVHIFGNLKYPFGDEIYLKPSNIFIHPPVPQCDLHKLLSSFDIGLALEPGKDLNNQLALSNKLLAYIQAGLLPLVSATPGQLDFVQKNDIDYVLLSGNENDLHIIMQKLYRDIGVIRSAAENRFDRARRFDYTNISLPLLKHWSHS